MPISMKRLGRAPSHSEMRRPTPKISMPVILQSTTNMNLNDMMDLPSARKMMAARRSEDDTPTPMTATEPELTDGSSASSSPTVEHNHLSTYFPGPAGVAAKAADIAPVLPKRVPSHSKREHERLARKRSIKSNIKSEPASAMTSEEKPVSERNSLEMIGAEPATPVQKTSTPTKRNSPRLENGTFTPELEKLTEAVEEQIKAQPEIEDEDSAYMRQRGLIRLDASDYLSSIGDCYSKLVVHADIGFQSADMSAWI